MRGALVVAFFLLTGCVNGLIDGVTRDGSGILSVRSFGVTARTDGEPVAPFHLGEATLAYPDGSGGLVYQPLEGDAIRRLLDGMVTTLTDHGRPGSTLQGVTTDGRIVVLEVDAEGRTAIRLLNPQDPDRSERVSLTDRWITGVGRASTADDTMVLSYRSGRCSWLDIRTLDGWQVSSALNPRPKEGSCRRPLVTDAVLSPDGGLIGFVETPIGRQVDLEGLGKNVVHPLRRPPEQSIVIVDLESGEETARVDVGRERIAGWIEPTPDGMIVGRYDPSQGMEPSIRRAPMSMDFGAVGQMEQGVGGFESGHIHVTPALFVGWDGKTRSMRGVALGTYADKFDAEGLCSAALFAGTEIGLPTNFDGMDEPEPPPTLFEPSKAAAETRGRIVAAARACDWSALDDLALSGSRPFNAISSGESAIETWREMELDGRRVLARLVDILQWRPIAEDPFTWDAIRGDQAAVGRVEIASDGEWLSYSYE